MGARKLLAGLAAVTAVAGGVSALGAGTASAATAEVVREMSSPCRLEAPGLPTTSTTARVKVTFTAPDTAVVGRPTAAIPWRAKGSADLDLSQGSPLQAALAQAGAKSVTTEVSVRLTYYQPGSSDQHKRVDHSGRTRLPALSVTASGSGVLPPFTFPTAGERVPALWFAWFSVDLTPRTADGSPTTLGTVPLRCAFLPTFVLWHSVTVAPR